MINAYILYTKSSSDRPIRAIFRILYDVIDAIAKGYKDAERFQRRPTLQMLYNQRFKDTYTCICLQWTHREVDVAGAA